MGARPIAVEVPTRNRKICIRRRRIIPRDSEGRPLSEQATPAAHGDGDQSDAKSRAGQKPDDGGNPRKFVSVSATSARGAPKQVKKNRVDFGNCHKPSTTGFI